MCIVGSPSGLVRSCKRLAFSFIHMLQTGNARTNWLVVSDVIPVQYWVSMLELAGGIDAVFIGGFGSWSVFRNMLSLKIL